MKLVNRSNLPQEVFNMLQQDFYDHESVKGSFSATQLLKPVQIIVLQERHNDKIEVDAMDRFWAVLGQATDFLIKRALKVTEGVEANEKRMFAMIGTDKISGEVDRIRWTEKEVVDYKLTSVYTIVYGSRIDDWRAQLSIYRLLVHLSKKILLKETGRIMGMFKDWRRKDSEKDGYPKAPVVEYAIKLWSIEDTTAFVTAKIKAIKAAMKLPDNKLPECTAEERWVNARTGESTRCLHYCEVASMCHQFKRISLGSLQVEGRDMSRMPKGKKKLPQIEYYKDGPLPLTKSEVKK